VIGEEQAAKRATRSCDAKLWKSVSNARIEQRRAKKKKEKTDTSITGSNNNNITPLRVD
jgi:hypothetical protein